MMINAVLAQNEAPRSTVNYYNYINPDMFRVDLILDESQIINMSSDITF